MGNAKAKSEKNDQAGAGLFADYDVREVGTIQSIREFLVVAIGLPSSINGQIVEFRDGHLGLVMGIKREKVQILVLSLHINLRVGDDVYNRGQLLELPVGQEFLGRVVNSLCEPVDGLGPIASERKTSVFADVPGVMDRLPVTQAVGTGTVALDAVIPIAKGQRQLLIGDRLTGKTTVAIDTILNQKNTDTLCIYCSIGKPYSSLTTIIDLLREHDAMPYSIVVDSSYFSSRSCVLEIVSIISGW